METRLDPQDYEKKYITTIKNIEKSNLSDRNKIEAKGKVSYQESVRAHNTIRLPRLVIEQFPDLRNALSQIIFKIKLYKRFQELKKDIWQMEYSKEQPPLLLFLYSQK